MKLFKKLLILLLAVVSITCFALGCGGENSSNSSSSNQISSLQQSSTSNLSNQSQTSSSVNSSVSSNSSSLSENQGKISFNSLNVSGNVGYGKVSNATTSFSFLNEISVSGNVSYRIFNDYNCNNEVSLEYVYLIEGDNVFYVIEYSGLNETKYKITIRRLPMVSVTFDTKGGMEVEGYKVEEGTKINEPTSVKEGYNLVGWDYDFIVPITKNTTISAIWQARTDTPYKIEYYFQNIENYSEYIIDSTLTEELQGETDSEVFANIKEIEGYEATEKSVRTTIKGDGSTILKVYYDIKKIFSVNYLGYIDEYYDYATNFSSVTIPSKINNKEIVGISSNAFRNWTTLESITFPNTIKTIESYAFRNCSGLKNIDFGNGLETIGSCAFIGCSLITNYNIPTSVKKVGSYAFSGNTNLERIIIPSSVTNLGIELFDGCSNLQELTIPFIGESGSETTATTSTLFGNLFGNNAYDGATETKQYYKTYGSFKYYIPKSLKSVTVTGGNIMYGAFYNCINIENITLGEGVGIIGDSAFYNCTSLNNFTISKNVKQIGENAFLNCSKLTSVSFENPNGWFVTQEATAISGTSVSVTNLSDNATNLKTTYSSYYWKRSV